jgi:hypothetical protein
MSEHQWARDTFAEYGITVVPANVVPAVGQTRAPATLERIRNRHGEAHARFCVMTLSDTANSKGAIDEVTLWAVSDLIRAAQKNYPSLMENNVEAWFAFFDGIPLGQLEYWTLGLDGVVSKRHALVGMVWERILRRFGDMHVQPDLLDDRRKIA